jgi:hypothetical protein
VRWRVQPKSFWTAADDRNRVGTSNWIVRLTDRPFSVRLLKYMRFKATNENLTIQLSADEVAACVSKIVRMFVPHYTRKVYLFAKQQPFEFADSGLVVVVPEDLPSNFLQSFRLILRPGELVVVSGQLRFTREQWRNFAAQLESLATS